jgi:hypothetical protein
LEFRVSYDYLARFVDAYRFLLKALYSMLTVFLKQLGVFFVVEGFVLYNGLEY